VNQAAESAAAELQAATDEAVASVHQAAEEATATIVVAVEAANKTIMEEAEKSVTEIAGDDKGVLFDLDSLKKRWRSTG